MSTVLRDLIICLDHEILIEFEDTPLSRGLYLRIRPLPAAVVTTIMEWGRTLVVLMLTLRDAVDAVLDKLPEIVLSNLDVRDVCVEFILIERDHHVLLLRLLFLAMILFARLCGPLFRLSIPRALLYDCRSDFTRFGGASARLLFGFKLLLWSLHLVLGNRASIQSLSSLFDNHCLACVFFVFEWLLGQLVGGLF